MTKIKKRNNILLVSCIFLYACGIDDLVYIAKPQRISSGVILYETDGCIFPGGGNDAIRNNLLGFDVFYSFAGNPSGVDNYQKRLTGNYVESLNNIASLPLKDTSAKREYYRLFTNQVPSYLYDQFYKIAIDRRDTDFSLIFTASDSGFSFTDGLVNGSGVFIVNEARRYVRTEGSTDYVLKSFADIVKTDNDVGTIENIDDITKVYMYLYIFLYGLDADNLNVAYCDEPLRVGPFEFILR